MANGKELAQHLLNNMLPMAHGHSKAGLYIGHHQQPPQEMQGQLNAIDTIP